MRKPYIVFWPDRWQNDIGLRSCHPIARAFWIDLLCMMSQGEPYGHLRIKPPAKPAHSQATARALAQATAQVPAQATARASAQATAQVPAEVVAFAQPHVFDVYEVPESGSLEPMLPQLLNAPAELVTWAITHLESHNVFSRTEEGIIYSRKMVRDHAAHQEHVQRGRNNQKKQEKRRQEMRSAAIGNAPAGNDSIVSQPRHFTLTTAQAPARASAQATARASAQATTRASAQAPAQALTPPISISNTNGSTPSPPTPPSASGKGGAKGRTPRQNPKDAAMAILQEQDARRRRK